MVFALFSALHKAPQELKAKWETLSTWANHMTCKQEIKICQTGHVLLVGTARTMSRLSVCFGTLITPVALRAIVIAVLRGEAWALFPKDARSSIWEQMEQPNNPYKRSRGPVKVRIICPAGMSPCHVLLVQTIYINYLVHFSEGVMILRHPRMGAFVIYGALVMRGHLYTKHSTILGAQRDP